MALISQINGNSIADTTARSVANSEYTKPATGIPATDLNSTVQTRLDRAATMWNVYDESGFENSDKFASQAFVNSSIASETAHFLGTYDATTDLGLTKPATHAAVVAKLNERVLQFPIRPYNNDYCYVINLDSSSHPIYEKYKYLYEGEPEDTFEFEYAINNSSFTTAQWASINSGVKASDIEDLNTHILSTNNPHLVTKAQVGLGNVDNKSEATIKSDFTGSIASGNTSFPTGGAVYTALAGKSNTGHGHTATVNYNLSDAGDGFKNLTISVSIS